MSKINLEKFGLSISFIGTDEKKEIAEKMLIDILTLPSIVAISWQDIENITSGHNMRLFVHQFKVPVSDLDIDQFQAKLHNITRIVYGIYGSENTLDIHLIYRIMTAMSQRIIADELFDAHNGTALRVNMSDDIIKIVALLSV